jgi:chemotaxis protein MotB
LDQKDGPAPEIIIIRRGGRGHDEGHHGGAWKIAYADFMTAMMALFLVMWLIGASDEKTISGLATYFNPVPLTDRTTTQKGIQDMSQGGTGKNSDRKPANYRELDGNSPPKNASVINTPTDEGLFSDPYNILTKLASKASKMTLPTSGGGIRQDGDASAADGTAFRDPFDPESRFNSMADDVSKVKPRNVKSKYDKSADIGRVGQQNLGDSSTEPQVRGAGGGQSQSGGKAEMEAKKAELAEAGEQFKAVNEAISKQIAIDAKQIDGELRMSIADAGLAKTPEITVEQTPEGVLISVTDQLNFEMFAISSAEPRPELVVVMEKLAKALSAQPGRLVIRGHTDGRPFSSKTYDNWRLSTARAQIAYYMLARGGFDEQRVERIEGYADRNLKVSGDPNAAQNRRIEILLRPAKT